MFEFLKTRSEEEEIMDDFDCHGEVVNQTLRELHSINTYLGGTNISLNSIRALIRQHPQEKYRIVDLGCGGGDTLKLLAQWAASNKKSLQLTGIDANPHIVEYAQQNTQQFDNIQFYAEDIYSADFLSKKFDIAHCSLFLHHFDEEAIVELFHQLQQQVSLGIVINDLHRHPISYYFTKWLLTAWSRSTMVKNDSVLSVARSFTRKELTQYLASAKIKNYTLKWKWAFRWELVIHA
ncbi:methyltransferase domain-containing protein [Reichenbachiella agarivorans]|uniref:Methyltransferase domain-containing protein n=1 Tax=Reichenbachiella agarivorans TaxID=2979464 RepID=A0ABY6CT07_9BACT|nr:methyltransferase domain-containing protein [Reichenbachiella agarivorans]UXP33657.1 methyltransferase domain-containing protein [Reichenbachiella agarivorans]